MKIKLKVLGLPSTSGRILTAQDFNDSTSDYESLGNAITEIYFQDKTGVISGERLGTEHTVWIPYAAVLRRPYRGDQMLLNYTGKTTILTIETILFDTGNLVEITLAAGQDTKQIQIGTYIVIDGATNAVNNGRFRVVDVDHANLIMTIENLGRSDNSDDELSTSATIAETLERFEVVDIEDKVLSGFENHYMINISHKND